MFGVVILIGPVWTMETCCISLEAIHNGEKAAVLTKKGGDSINAKRLIAVEPGETVHQKCRKDLCRPMTHKEECHVT